MAWSAPGIWPAAGLKVRVLEAAADRRRRGGDRGIPPRIPQFGGQLHGQPAESAGDRRHAACTTHGLRIVERPISNFLPQVDETRYLKLGGGLERTQAEFGGSPIATPRCCRPITPVLDDIGRRAARPGPADPAQRSAAACARLLRRLRQGGRLASMPLGRQGATCWTCSPRARGSFLDGWFESEPVKAAFGFDAVVGNYASPDSPGSAYVLLHHTFGEVNGKKGAWGHAIGGMGAITQAMAKACAARRRRDPDSTRRSARVLVEDGRARQWGWNWSTAGASPPRSSPPTSILRCCSSA